MLSDTFLADYERRFEKRHRHFRRITRGVAERYLLCANLNSGFARSR